MTNVKEKPRLTTEQEAECRLLPRVCVMATAPGPYVRNRLVCGRKITLHVHVPQLHKTPTISRYPQLACPAHGWVTFANTEPGTK